MATRKGKAAAAPAVRVRRQPSQARSEHTVQLIFEATAQVLRDHGESGLNTNRIAERAGLSVGTLYQYFGSKEAIVLAILSRTREKVLHKLDRLMADADAASMDPRQLLQAYVSVYVSEYGVGRAHQRELVRLAWSLDRHELMVQSLREASEKLSIHLQRLRHPQVQSPTPTMLFVLTRGLAGIVRAAVLEASPVLGTQAFEDELVNALWGVLTGCAHQSPSRSLA
jgi:AcrR family transcriptional regulator